MEFETYQPALITPNNITSPTVFNGFCLIRRYKVTVEEVYDSPDVLELRLRQLWSQRAERGITHSNNINAMNDEADKLGILLK